MVAIKIDMLTIKKRYMDCLEEITYKYRSGKIVLSKYLDEEGEFFEVQTELGNFIGIISDTFSTEDEALKAGKNNLDQYYKVLLEAANEDIS